MIGVTAGNIDQLAAFSTETEHCSGKFPVAADPDAAIAKSYDATLAMRPGWSDRTSYVIAPDDKVIFAYSDLKPDQHVALTLDAVTKWRAGHAALTPLRARCARRLRLLSRACFPLAAAPPNGERSFRGASKGSGTSRPPRAEPSSTCASSAARPRRPPKPEEGTQWRYYEHVLIARQDISPQQAETLNEELKALIEGLGGHIAKIEYWGLRNLTYRIKKNRKGHYSLLAIDAPAGGGEGDGAPAVHQRGRAALPDRARRGARPGAFAGARPPRPRARPRAPFDDVPA